MVPHLKTFPNKGCKITAFFGVNFATIRRLYNKDQEVIDRIVLVLVLLSALAKRFFVSGISDFCKKDLYFFKKSTNLDAGVH